MATQQPELGKLLFKRSGTAFKVEAVTPESVEIMPVLDEAALWAKKSNLSIFIALPGSTVMTVQANADKDRLASGWRTVLAGGQNAYLGPDRRTAHQANQASRTRLLRASPRQVSTTNRDGWIGYLQATRGPARDQFEMAERWARLMERGLRVRQLTDRDIVYVSLLYADQDGIFGPQTRDAILKPLAMFWPYYEGTIVRYLDDF